MADVIISIDRDHSTRDAHLIARDRTQRTPGAPNRPLLDLQPLHDSFAGDHNILIVTLAYPLQSKGEKSIGIILIIKFIMLEKVAVK
jgi:hypothetical protein